MKGPYQDLHGHLASVGLSKILFSTNMFFTYTKPFCCPIRRPQFNPYTAQLLFLFPIPLHSNHICTYSMAIITSYDFLFYCNKNPITNPPLALSITAQDHMQCKNRSEEKNVEEKVSEKATASTTTNTRRSLPSSHSPNSTSFLSQCKSDKWKSLTFTQTEKLRRNNNWLAGGCCSCCKSSNVTASGPFFCVQL